MQIDSFRKIDTLCHGMPRASLSLTFALSIIFGAIIVVIVVIVVCAIELRADRGIACIDKVGQIQIELAHRHIYMIRINT